MKAEDVKRFHVDYWTKSLQRHGDTPGAVGQSHGSQAKRFEKILEIGSWPGRSVLDIGCGLGDFYDFLRAKNRRVEYTGFDVTPGMVDAARRKHPHASHRFEVADILTESIRGTYDYVISVGALNLPLEGQNVEIMLELIEKMYVLCSIGIAVSMTSSLTKKPQPDTYYYRPSIIVDRIGAFCQNFRLDHTFLPHDFILFCYKKSLYS